MSWLAAAGSAFGGAASALGGYLSYKAQKKVLQNRHQWEVDDLRKAGLNPILSATHSAGGQAAPIVADVAGGMAKGAEAGKASSADDLLKAQTDAARAQERMFDASAEKTNAETYGLRNVNWQSDAYRGYLEANPAMLVGTNAAKALTAGGAAGVPMAAVGSITGAVDKNTAKSLIPQWHPQNTNSTAVQINGVGGK